MISEQIIEFKDGVAYEQMMGVWTQLIGSQFIDWVAPKKQQRWVDVGCGNGAFTEQIIALCSPTDVQGIDPSQAQIDYANGRSLERVAFFQTGDGMDLPYDTNYFDYATMALVLFFVPDPTKGVSEMQRIVRPGGTIAAYVWDVFEGGLPMEPCHAELRSMGIDYPLPPSAAASKTEVLTQLWSTAGLKNIKTCKIAAERTFTSFEEFWNVTAKSPALQDVLADLSSRSTQQLKAAVKHRLPTASDGSVTYAAHANAIQGVV
ncbi:MAG: class I SAM-dependent methyltransferase [Paracoccaceae bacterium]|nr:class I SAM-dependent methyltransferase [Paracoccaceae bacterium]